MTAPGTPGTRAGTHNAALRSYVETHHIDRIPEAARHGTLGLTFWWALLAIAVGIAAGALLIALHATQGPRLGVPQSIQSRAQFGFFGAGWMFIAVWVLNVGFIASELVIQAQSMQGVTGG